MSKLGRNPQKARQYFRGLAQRTAAAQHPSAPRVWRVFKAKWPGIGTVLCCDEHAALLGAAPADLALDQCELECFVCGRELTPEVRVAA
jgi:hypothetical protein